MDKQYYEEARWLKVYDGCELLIIGSGAAGHSAAIAAARAGCRNIILMDRYGYSGGDVTGGYVIMVPDLSWYDKQFVKGLQEEWFQRMKHIPGAVRGPEGAQMGSTDPLLCDSWKALHDCWSRGEDSPHRLVRSVYFEPNQLKIELDKMLLEERQSIQVLYHSTGVCPIMDGNTVKGVVFESKEGRQAIFAKAVIDATGDGDIFSQTRPEAFAALRGSISKVAGFRAMPLPTNSNEMCWINNWHAEKDCTKIKDQTETEMATRASMREVLAYLKEAVPMAFRNAYLYDIAPQLGTRISRRLVGEYVMSTADFAYAIQHDDVIAWHSTICQVNDCGPVEIPYRAIVPQKVEGLLCPGRHISADDVAIDWLNLIPQCVGTGQAAGVAAAVALSQGTSLRGVDIRRVQDILVEQDVPLPRNEKFLSIDKGYQELVEEKKHGLYTKLAAKARENAKHLESFHQW